MNIKNYTSGVAAERSISKIEGILMDIGASNINKSYEDKRLVGITFIMLVDGRSLLFRLPAKADAVINALKKTDWPSQSPDEKGNYPLSLEDYKKSRSAIGFVDWDSHSTGWIIRTKSQYSVNDDGTVMTSIIHGTHGEREIIGNIYQTSNLLK